MMPRISSRPGQIIGLTSHETFVLILENVGDIAP